MSKIIDLLKKCAETYTNIGEYYVANASECVSIEEELDKKIFESYPIEITDDIYDSLTELAKIVYPNDPFFNKVGSQVERNMGKVKLPFIMGSMTEAHKGELTTWLKSNTEYVLSKKLDGISCGLVYRNGLLVEAYTRGDGYEGQNITKTVKRFGNQLPKSIDFYGELMVRGEIIVAKDDEKVLMEELKEETGKKYKNLRNLCAGCLNSKIAPNAFVKYANFVAYYIDKEMSSETEMFKTLINLGFETPYYKTLNSNDFNEGFLEDLNKDLKKQYKYEVDGTIITQNLPTVDVNGYESGTINPKRSRKFKVGIVDNFGITVVKNIRWQLSSYGYMKPVVEIEPVDIDGVTISNVTGNNYANLVKNHIGIGTKIKVIRSGMVIQK